MRKVKSANRKAKRRARRVRVKLRATSSKPRLSVLRSNKHIHAQIIDDAKGKTLAAASSLEIAGKKKTTKTGAAKMVGEALAKKAIALGIKEVVFDKGKYKYHGRIKALADGTRENGLQFSSHESREKSRTRIKGIKQ